MAKSPGKKQSKSTSVSKKKASKAATSSAPAKPVTGSVYSNPDTLPAAFVKLVRKLEEALGGQAWLFLQNDRSAYGSIGPDAWQGIYNSKKHLRSGKKPILIVDSGGGSARDAYKIARFLQREAGGYTAVVPDYAKSAATLLVLGADELYLGKHAELGPLDAQLMDAEREKRQSVLDDVQTLERLNAFALRALDETVQLLLRRTGKKVMSVMPWSIQFSADIVRPLAEGLDVHKLTEMSRILKIGEEYAYRLLKPDGATERQDTQARQTARRLVELYPEHGFVIDTKEAREIGINISELTDELDAILEPMAHMTDRITVLGPLTEVLKP